MTDRERAILALGQVYLPPSLNEATIKAIEAQLTAARAEERERQAKEAAARQAAQIRAALIRGGM